jgi:hypothetical protein
MSIDPKINIPTKEITTILGDHHQKWEPSHIAGMVFARITEDKGTEDESYVLMLEFLVYAIHFGVGQMLLNARNQPYGTNRFQRKIFKKAREILLKQLDQTYKLWNNYPLPLPKYVAHRIKDVH